MSSLYQSMTALTEQSIISLAEQMDFHCII
jgi:hypothetical protein